MMYGNTLKIFYFSGTGNAKQVALWFSELAIDRNMDCRLYNIAETNSVQDIINSEDLLMIISPIHGFTFPKITMDFIRQLPEGKNRIVLMNTRGGVRIGRIVTPGVTGSAFMLSSIILRLKGYTIIGQIPFDMPSNWLSIHPALREKSVNFIFEKNRERVRKHFEKLYAGKTDFSAYKDIIQDIIIFPVSVAYYFVGRFFLSKSFYASSKCNNCNLCVKECPVKAIKTVDQRPFWTFKCQSCMKCMNRCPARAIETPHGLWIAVFYVSAIGASLLCSLLPASIHHWLIAFAIFNAICLGLIALLYKIQHHLLKNRIFSKIILFTSLTYYKFWGRYKITNMEYTIRKLNADEYDVIKEFTYQAIFLRDEKISVPTTVLDRPELKVFYEDFGKPNDECLIVEVDNKIVGAVWTRILSGEVKGFGNIDDETPEFAISLFKEYRNRGIGTKLMLEMIDYLRNKGYKQCSLAVQKDNYAVKMYKNVGFEIIKEKEEEYLMVYNLK